MRDAIGRRAIFRRSLKSLDVTMPRQPWVFLTALLLWPVLMVGGVASFLPRMVGVSIAVAAEAGSKTSDMGKTPIATEHDARRGQPAARRPSGALDLDHIKRMLEQFQADEAEARPETRARPQRNKVQLTLQRSLEIALQHNLRIQIAKLTRDAVQTELPRAKARFHPLVGISVTGSGAESATDNEADLSENSVNANAFIQEEVPTGATLTVSGDLTGREQETGVDTLPRAYDSDLLVKVVQPLLRGGGLVVATRPIRDAQFDLRIEEARLRADVLRVTANTKSAYYNMLLAEKVIEVIKEAIQRDKTLIEASQALFEAGLVTKRDVFSAEIILAQDSARLANAEASLESAKNALLDVLGLPFATPVVLLETEIKFQPVRLAVARWIATALERRPELVEIEEALEKSLLQIRVGKNDVLPRVDFVASYERFQGDSTFGEAFDFQGEAWSAGVTVSVPIGNVAAKSALARARIEHTRLQKQLEQTKRQIELEVRAAVIKLRRSLERMTVLTAGVEQARGKLEFAKARFALGLATNLDITDAQEALLNAETDLLSAIVDYNVGLAELEARIAAPIQSP